MWLELKFRNCFITNGENTTHTKTRVYYRLFVVCVCILVLKITNHCVQVWCPWQPPVFAVVHTLPQEVLPLPLSHLFLTNSDVTWCLQGVCVVCRMTSSNSLVVKSGIVLLAIPCVCSAAGIGPMATSCVCSAAGIVPMATSFAVVQT